jgi:predicted dehydrogenase
MSFHDSQCERPMLNSPIRWGILGTGQIARAFATGLRDVPGAELAAIASRNGDSAQAFAEEFGASRHYGNYQLLASDPQVDVIYVATPHNLHAENTIMCLQAGKAVLCEKPFTINRRQASEAITLARQKKLFLMEAMWTRYLPAIQEAKRLLDQGAIGTPRHIQADFGFAADVNADHRLLSKQFGGGALLDIGIYPLSVAAYFLGEIGEAHAQATLGDTGVDLQTAFILRHRSGGLSSCICSIVAPSPDVLTISGSAGIIQVNAPFFKSQSLTVTTPDGSTRTVQLPYLGNGYTHEAIEVGRCLREGLLESPSMSLDETLALMTCLDTIRAQIGVSYPVDEGEVA